VLPYLKLDSVFEEIGLQEVPNPHRSSQVSSLVSVSDLIDNVIQTHGIDGIQRLQHEYHLRQQQQAVRKVESRLKALAKQEKRRDELASHLTEVGLVIRSDSTLCQEYIQGKRPKKQLESIVRLLAREKLFREYCEWARMWKYKEDERHEVIEAGFIPDTDVYDDVKYTLSDRLWKREEPPKDYIWPWLRGLTPETWRQTDEYKPVLLEFQDSVLHQHFPIPGKRQREEDQLYCHCGASVSPRCTDTVCNYHQTKRRRKDPQ